MDRHKFKAARLAQNMSQGALAKAVGLSPADISRIESGYRDIRPQEAAALATALGLVAAAPAASIEASLPPAATSPVPPVAISTPQVSAAAPVGTNLDDPANFTELPDLLVLERGALSPTAHRDRLVAALARTTKVLHTSRVRATVWREWRQFEKRIHALLQTG